MGLGRWWWWRRSQERVLGSKAAVEEAEERRLWVWKRSQGLIGDRDKDREDVTPRYQDRETRQAGTRSMRGT